MRSVALFLFAYAALCFIYTASAKAPLTIVSPTEALDQTQYQIGTFARYAHPFRASSANSPLLGRCGHL
jgi:hypothetical protein